VRCIRQLLLPGGPLARVLHGQRGCDHERIVEASLPRRFEHHARKPWIDRHACHLATCMSQAPLRIERAKLHQRGASLLDGTRRR
jgi:hypothetical protein